MELYKKLLNVKAEVGQISKDSTNPFFKSKYFDINALLEHVEPILKKHGLLLLQPIANNKVVSQIFDPETGENVTSEMELPPLDDPQKMGSAITYFRRYTLQSLLGLQAEDDDGAKASRSKAAAPVAKPTGWESLTPQAKFTKLKKAINDVAENKDIDRLKKIGMELSMDTKGVEPSDAQKLIDLAASRVKTLEKAPEPEQPVANEDIVWGDNDNAKQDMSAMRLEEYMTAFGQARTQEEADKLLARLDADTVLDDKQKKSLRDYAAGK